METNNLQEAKQVGPAMLVTGALNPYTRAHEEMAGMAMQHAHKTGHTHFYHGIGSSELKPDAPLTHEQKTKLVTGSHRYLRRKYKLPVQTGVIPRESSVSPFHQIAHLIERGHRDITIALGSDQLAQGGLKSQIEAHMKKHGGFLGTDKKPHQVSIKFHQLGGTRHEGDMDRAQIIREVAAGNLRTVKAGRLRGAVQSGDFELASAMMPESIKNKKGYFTLIAKQQKAVADAAAKKKVRKKKLTECFSAEKIEEFSKLLNEAQLVRGVIEQRKNKRLDVMNKMKQQFVKVAAVLMQQQRTQKATVGSSPALSQQHKAVRQQERQGFLNNMRSALQNVKMNFAGRIIKAKKKEIDLGLDIPPRRVGNPQKPRKHTMSEEMLNEARKRGVASPSKVMRKTRTEVRSAGNPKKKDTIRKQDERRDAKKSPKFAVVIGRDKKIKIVRKEDIGKSKVILAPDKFDKAKAKRYLDDPTFEITDSSKKLFPEFKRQKAKAKTPAGKKKEEKKKTKPKKPTVTKKNPRDVLPAVPETPKGGKERTTQKSQYPDWNHNATDLEEAIPTIFNAIAKVKTGSEDAGATELLKTSKTLAPSTERAVRQIMAMVVPQIGECVAIHMGKQNDGKPSKDWLKSGGANATSKSDIVFVPKKLWSQAKGKNLSEKLKSLDASKCIRASMKCGASQIVNGEAGEAIATIDAANMIAGDIAAKNRKVARLIKEAKDIISKFAKSAETGQYEVGEIRSYIESGKEPKDKAFAQAKRIVEEQDKVQKMASAKLIEIYNASPEFMEAFIYEGARGGIKHGDDSIRCATHMISMNKDGTDVKLQLIDMKLVRKLRPAIKFRCRFKPRSKMVKGVKIRTLSSAFNVDLRSIQEEVESVDQQTPETPKIDFSGSAARVDEDLKMIGNNVTALTNYMELEPDLVTTNEVDVGDYMEGSARDYNEIIIDGQTQVMIPVIDYQTFENVKQNLGEDSYEFINDFIVENAEDEDAFDLLLTSGLLSEELINKAVINPSNHYAEILNEMVETGLLRPDMLDNFLEEARNYKKEYREYHSKPEQRANRSKRVLARRKMMKKGRVSKGDGKDVHHEDGNPQNNGDSNLKVLSKSKNRAMHEEHGAGEVGTDELRKKYIQDTPYAIDPLKVLKGVVKHGVRRK